MDYLCAKHLFQPFPIFLSRLNRCNLLGFWFRAIELWNHQGKKASCISRLAWPTNSNYLRTNESPHKPKESTQRPKELGTSGQGGPPQSGLLDSTLTKRQNEKTDKELYLRLERQYLFIENRCRRRENDNWPTIPRSPGEIR